MIIGIVIIGLGLYAGIKGVLKLRFIRKSKKELYSLMADPNVTYEYAATRYAELSSKVSLGILAEQRLNNLLNAKQGVQGGK